jgi:hypothetical protein
MRSSAPTTACSLHDRPPPPASTPPTFIGTPPVIGADGIIYGLYEVPDLASVPITPAGGEAEWATEVAVPQDATGLYILLSAKSGKQRLYANYAVDITDK